MARQLSELALASITRKDIKIKRTFKINDVDRSAFLKTASRSFDKAYGSSSASFVLHNPNGIFSIEGIYEISIGDVVELIYQYENDTILYPSYYGIVNQRGIVKNATTNEITLTCLDYICMLQNWDIELLIEGTKIQIEDEVLTPNLLPSPNEMYAQTFNFANDAISTSPVPTLQIRDRLHELNDPAYDGFEFYYSSGQVKFGFPINVRDNYDVIAKSYSFYTAGVFVEDAIEQILTQPNGYGEYMFGELSAQDVIDNHLTDTYYNVSGLTLDTLTPNFTPTISILDGILQEDYYGAKPPIIHYKFNDNTNNDIVVDTSNNYEGSFRDGTAYSQTIYVTNVSGKISRAFDFNGDDWNVNCGDVQELNECRRATITFWLASDEFGQGSGGTLGEEIYFIKTNGAAINPSYFKLYTTVSDELIFQVTQQGVYFTATLANYSSQITRTVLSHYRLMLDFTQTTKADKIKLFIDDVEQTLVITGAYSPPRLPNTLGFDFVLGNVTNSISGLLDDFRFYDFIVPNAYTEAIYNSGTGTEDTIGVTYLVLDTTEGFLDPQSSEIGEGQINGDIFTYATKDDTHLYGIPLTGENSLNEHKAGSVVKTTFTKDSGHIWYLKYTNVITDMTTTDFSLPSGVTVEKFDKRYGRIYLSEAVPVDTVITTTTNYSFKTLQASGVEINRIRFTQRETNNRFEAINKLRDWVAPNYVIRTQGDRKIWSSFLTQRTIQDFDLNLKTGLSYLEDTDLYTRVVLFGMNNNPTNLMFGDSVEFVTTGEEYKGYASMTELTLIGGQGVPIIPNGADETYANWIRERVAAEATSPYYLYATGIPNAGFITVESVVPTVWIDNVAIDNIKHQQIMQPIRWEKTTTTETTTITKPGFFGTGGSTSTETKTYYHYKIIFAHHSIEPTEDIILYDAYGVEVYRIVAGSNVGYGSGIYTVPGDTLNATIESIATATYWVFYSSSNLIIDYDNAIFKVHQSLIPFPSETSVRATFEYIHTMTPIQGIAKVIDGRWDTQVQTTFYAEPPPGYNYGIIDLGQESDIQAIDIVAGFYRPDSTLKFDIDMTVTLHYSLDNLNYYPIGDKASNLHFTGGSSVKLEEDALGIDFRARYLKVVLESVGKIEYQRGVWPVAFTEISAYSNITLRAEAKLIPTTVLISNTVEQSGEQDITVVSTHGFLDPESGSTETAFIGEDEFTYTGLTATKFLGCVGLTEPHSRADYVVQYEDTDTDSYDPDFMLPKLGDRLYKNLNIKEGFLYTQDEINRIAKAYLIEFYKNHSKAQIDVMFSPHLLVGDTVHLIDTVNGIDDLYFVENISDNNGISYSITVAKYPN